MQTSPIRRKVRSGMCRGVATLPFMLALALSGCGGTMAFSDTSSLVIVGDPPKPPEPPKEEPPPPPKPKRVEVTADKIVIREKIQFDLNKATIKSDSHELLGEIVDVFKENSHIKKVSIEGHTDNQGSDAYNQKLSDQRAKSVVDYLVSKASTPSASPRGATASPSRSAATTREGKEENRRVEFLITEQEEVTKTFEIDPKTGKKKEVEEDDKKDDKKDKEES